MPPKKVVEEEVLGPWSLGRFSSNLKVRVRVRARDDDDGWLGSRARSRRVMKD
jgi:hypothetical protein